MAADPLRNLLAKIELFAAVSNEIKASMHLDIDARRHELVRLRRVLSLSLGAVSAAGEDALASDTDRLSAFRTRFSSLRSRIALHQAEWPAVPLGRGGDDGFYGSAALVQSETRDFLLWARSLG